MSSSLRQNTNGLFQSGQYIAGSQVESGNYEQNMNRSNISPNSSQLKELFAEFRLQDRNAISSTDFLEHLTNANMLGSCSLLAAKLRAKKGSVLSETEFYQLFNFDFTSNEDNLNIILTKFSEVANAQQQVTPRDISKLSQKYNLTLTQQEIELIINYAGSQTESGHSVGYATIQQIKELVQRK